MSVFQVSPSLLPSSSLSSLPLLLLQEAQFSIYTTPNTLFADFLPTFLASLPVQSNRDRILLDDTSNQQRRTASDDEFDDEEEVFAHKNIPGSDDDEDQDQEEYDSTPAQPKKKKERKPKPLPSTEPKGRFAKPARSSSSQSGSDSENDASDAEAASGSGSGSGSEDETWGTNANAYYARPSTRRARDDEEDGSGDEDLEERREMEDREARKLQRKGREAMSGGDFGLEDLGRLGAGLEEEEEEEEQRPAAPTEPLPTDAPSLLRHLERTAPETLALAREWGDIALRIPKLGEIIQLQQEEDPNHPSLGLTVLHYQTLLTYATTLAFYLHLASLPLDKRPTNLSSHPVLQRLVQLKAGLSGLENLDMGGDEDDSDEDEDDEDDLDSEFTSYGVMGGKGKDWDEDAQQLWEQERRGGLGLEDDELKELMADYLKGNGGARELAEEEEEEEDEDSELEEWETRELEKARKSATAGVKATKKEKKDKKREKKAAAAGASSSSSSSKPKKSIFPTLEEPTPSFANPTASTSKSRSSSSKPSTSSTSTSTLDDPHSESTTLSLADSSAKASARHSLRFHTSKIDSASARRSSARQGRMGGDEDIPYRNKQAGRDAALRKNAPKGAVGQDTDLDGAEWGEEDRKTARDVKGMDREMEGEGGEDMEGEDGYYQLVKKRKREEKEEKQDAYDEVRDASRITDDVTSGSGPRSLTRAILKNKGLTPHRNKAVRNPRVKKRMRFDKAKKQVSSMQAVYKGGQGALKGNYGGEATGISTVVKSRKFV
ncbi:hypothetical protein BDY24DRAFT_242893 [Mrakia frigida]|uniref:something about silencing 10 family protein n=1 Tax=Mrakia frigida TaxID=29902 RepID=UPI003FCC159B